MPAYRGSLRPCPARFSCAGNANPSPEGTLSVHLERAGRARRAAGAAGAVGGGDRAAGRPTRRDPRGGVEGLRARPLRGRSHVAPARRRERLARRRAAPVLAARDRARERARDRGRCLPGATDGRGEVRGVIGAKPTLSRALYRATVVPPPKGGGWVVGPR